MWLGAVVVNFVEAYANIWSENIPIKSQYVGVIVDAGEQRKKKSLDHLKPHEMKISLDVFQPELFP